MIELTLTDLIDVSTLQEIQDGFANLTGMAALTTDAAGTAVTKGSNFTDFCMNYTRKSKVGCARCEQCDKSGGEETMRTGRATAYFCHGGLVDFAAPILLNVQFIGSFIGGQVLTEEPDENKFRRIASEIGVNPDEYIRALRKIRIIEKKKVDAAADFVFIVAKALSNIAYQTYTANRTNTILADMNDSIMNKVDEAQETVKNISQRIHTLSTAFDDVNHIAEESSSEIKSTANTLKMVQKVAMNTRILGFNASIEASRAGEHGKGFQVVAEEVRNLAESSKQSADLIEQAMQKVADRSQHMSQQVTQTKGVVEQCLSDLDEFSNILNAIKAVRVNDQENTK